MKDKLKDPVSRRKFMALSGGSAAAAAFLAACGSDDDSSMMETTTSAKKMGGSETEQFGKGDLGIVNYALTLEYLEAAFYADVVKSGLFKGAELKTIEKFGQEEAEHVEALTQAAKALGGWRARSRTSAPPPTSVRPPTSRAPKCWPRRSRSTASRAATRRP
jgi:hypothetical protein